MTTASAGAACEAQPPPEIPASQCDQALDALKGLAIIGVLIVHMSFVSRFSSTTLAWIGALQQVFGWCVIGFFFCAGVLTRPEALGGGAIRRLVLDRARRLLVPCFVFSLTYKGTQMIVERFTGFGPMRHLPTNLREAAQFLFVPVGPQFYFLAYLFVVAVASGLLIARFKVTGLIGWVVCVGCFGFYACQPTLSVAHGPGYLLLPGYVFGFWTGVMVRQWPLHRLWWMAVVLSVLALCVVRQSGIYAQFLAPAVLYGCLQLSSKRAGLPYLGRKSGAIFVWHDPLLLPALSLLAAHLISDQAVQVMVILALGVGIPIAIGAVVNRCKYVRYYRL